jgi:hypothetical protein
VTCSLSLHILLYKNGFKKLIITTWIVRYLTKISAN